MGDDGRCEQDVDLFTRRMDVVKGVVSGERMEGSMLREECS